VMTRVWLMLCNFYGAVPRGSLQPTVGGSAGEGSLNSVAQLGHLRNSYHFE